MDALKSSISPVPTLAAKFIWVSYFTQFLGKMAMVRGLSPTGKSEMAANCCRLIAGLLGTSIGSCSSNGCRGLAIGCDEHFREVDYPAESEKRRNSTPCAVPIPLDL